MGRKRRLIERPAGNRLDPAHDHRRPEHASEAAVARCEIEHAKRLAGRIPQDRLHDCRIRQIALLAFGEVAQDDVEKSGLRRSPPRSALKTGSPSRRGKQCQTWLPAGVISEATVQLPIAARLSEAMIVQSHFSASAARFSQSRTASGLPPNAAPTLSPSPPSRRRSPCRPRP